MAVIITPGDATPNDVRANKRFNAGMNYNAAGAMNEIGAINKSLAINETYTIPEGHTDGGTVTQSIPTKSATTYTPSQSVQTIASGQYLSGAQTISAVPVDASKVLAGTSIAGKAGTMPNRAGDTAALSTITSGTTLKLLASNGYRDGVDDYVTHTDANRIAGNIKKGVVLDGLTGAHNDVEVLEAGENLLVSGQNPVESILGISSTSFTKAAEIRINRAGYVRTTFTLAVNAATGSNVYGQIYKNGVAVGTLRSNNTTTYLTFTEDINVAVGDRIQLYLRAANTAINSQCHYFVVKSALASNIADYVYIFNNGS